MQGAHLVPLTPWDKGRRRESVETSCLHILCFDSEWHLLYQPQPLGQNQARILTQGQGVWETLSSVKQEEETRCWCALVLFTPKASQGLCRLETCACPSHRACSPCEPLCPSGRRRDSSLLCPLPFILRHTWEARKSGLSIPWIRPYLPGAEGWGASFLSVLIYTLVHLAASSWNWGVLSRWGCRNKAIRQTISHCRTSGLQELPDHEGKNE